VCNGTYKRNAVLYILFLFVSSIFFCRCECVSFVRSFDSIGIVFYINYKSLPTHTLLIMVSYNAMGRKRIFCLFVLRNIDLKYYIPSVKSETANDHEFGNTSLLD